MYKWVARIERELEEVEEVGFLNRPNVTVGEGFIRLLSLDREIFQPSEGVVRVIVTSVPEDGLLAILENTDLDELMGRALDSRDELVGQIITEIVRHMRLVREFAETLEIAEGT